MNDATFIQVLFIIILSIYGYTRILAYPTRTHEIATRIYLYILRVRVWVRVTYGY